MAFIPDKDKNDLKRRLQKELTSDVTIKLFTQAAAILIIPGRECPSCAPTQQLLEELVSLSPKLRLEVVNFYSVPEEARKYGVERIPAIVLDGAGEASIKFYGLPSGYEFLTILEDIIGVSRRLSGLKMETRKKLRQVNQPVHLQVFVTPT
ncbi:MAG: thioredoxin family protein [Chloroflexota bacterium]|nr:thioredoxin family protein [Chloroflexota bacterium]